LALGVGVNIKVPAFNEKQSGKKFGASDGQLTIRLVNDSYWSEARWRLVNDFRIDVFSLTSSSITISLYGKADIPLGNSSQSDLRLSVMSSVDVSTLTALIH
jgi:hypothetical protein